MMYISNAAIPQIVAIRYCTLQNIFFNLCPTFSVSTIGCVLKCAVFPHTRVHYNLARCCSFFFLRAILNEPNVSKKNPKFQILGTCTQAFLQMFSEHLEQSWARKISTGSFQILEPISTFPKYPCEGRHG